MNTFTNPYLSIPADQRRKVSIHVADSDIVHVEQIRSSHGTVTIILTTLFKKFMDELTKRGINDCTEAKQLEQFLTNCNITTKFSYGPNDNIPRHLDGGSTGGTSEKASKRNDPRRVEGRGKKVTGAKTK